MIEIKQRYTDKVLFSSEVKTIKERTMKLLRSVTANGTINGSLSPTAVRDIVRKYGKAIGIPDLNPHDLRRTMAKLSRLGGAPLETIQQTLGHASTKTTELYIRTGEEANAGDFIDL